MQTLPGLLAVAAVVVCSLGCRERLESHYATAQAVREGGAIERGWVPRWLPADAHDIREAHDLDTNANLVMFRRDILISMAVPSDCETVEAHRARAPEFRTAWWPDDMPPRQPGQHSYRIYRCGDGYMAFEEGQVVVYFWRPAG